MRAALGASPAAFFAVIYLLSLGWRPLLLPDEFRYAEIPREMLASGDWVVPRLDGLHYFEKPVLGYWLIAAAEALIGKNRFAARLPSALTTGLTALLVALVVFRAGGERARPAARLAALVYLSCLLACAVGTIAVLDATLTLFVTGTLVSFFLASTSRPSSGRERGFLLLSGVACGFAFLTKGFLALAVPSLVAAGYLCWQRRWLDLVRMPWLPAAAAVLVSAPWGLAVHGRAPDFWRFFFWHEHVQRFFEKEVGQHPHPWWFFLAATPLLLLPWTFFLPAAASGYRGAAHPPAVRDLVRFCLTWVAMTYLFFSSSSGKLLTYILPALPAVAILVAIGLSAEGGPPPGGPPPGGPPGTWRRGGYAGALVFALVAVGGAGALASGRTLSRFGQDPAAWGLLAALGLGAVTLALSARAAPGAGGPLLASWVLVPALLSLQIALPARMVESKAPGVFLSEHLEQVDAGDIVVADSNVVRAACWILERDDIVLFGDPGELQYGIERDRSRARWLDLAGVRHLIREHRGSVVLLASSSVYDEWRALLPTPDVEDRQAAHGVVFVKY